MLIASLLSREFMLVLESFRSDAGNQSSLCRLDSSSLPFCALRFLKVTMLYLLYSLWKIQFNFKCQI